MSGTTQEGDLVVTAVPGLWLEGTAGDDNLAGGDGNDTLLGGAGDDALNGGAGDDALNGGTGADLLQGGAGADSLHGGEGDDVLDGEAGDDTLSGGAGNDVLLDFEGVSLLYGDAGDDGLFTGAGADQLYGGEGNDYLSGGDGDDRLSGDAGDDTLLAGDGADTLHGGEGDDTYEGGTGGDALYDFSLSSADTYVYNLGDGADTVFDYGGFDTVRLGGGITAATTTVRCNTAGDLILAFADGGRLTLSSQYAASTGAARSNHQVEQIVFDDGTAWDQAQLRALALAPGTEGDDVIQGFDTDDTLAGAGGNDTLSGGDGDDALDGGDGNDRLDGGSGNNQLSGGAGRDSLRGGAGSDRFEGGTGDDFMFDPSATSGDSYHYRLGDGADTINDLGGADEVHLGAGIAPDGTSVRVDANGSVVLDFADGGSLRLMYQYDTATGAARAERIEQVRFEDGTVWDPSQLLARAFGGTAQADRLVGMGGADHLQGGDGDDVLYGRAGDDLLEGGAGRDHLYGEAGSDTLDGGAGNDVLDGGAGDDTYLLARGSGADTVRDHDGNADLLAIGAGVAVDQLWFRQVGLDLELSIIGTADQVTVADWYSGSDLQVEQFRTADGQALLASQVQALVSAMAAFAPPPLGQTQLSADVQAALAPVIAAHWT